MVEEKKTTPKKTRGHKLPAQQGTSLEESQTVRARDVHTPEEWLVPGQEEEESVPADASLTSGRPTPFSILLGFLLRNERGEIARVARAINVSDNTIYRWLNGTVSPRLAHVQRLLTVLSRPSASAHYQLAQTDSAGTGRHLEVPLELYRRVLEQAATTVDDGSRRWHIIETIFEHALLLFDPERRGMALTYAPLMPPQEDGTIHTLYEAEMRGQYPWPFALEFKMYLGSTTLAGSAVMSQRGRIWSKSEIDARQVIALDEHELSACAAPVMRGNRIAGVLIVSSTREDFVHHPEVLRAVTSYAHLLAAGLTDKDFYPADTIRLVPMPDLAWQRERIASSYVNRVIECARKQCLSYPEAEQKVLRALEKEFEHYASHQIDHRIDQQEFSGLRGQ